MALIERPNLEIRNEERLAAEAIARATGAQSVELIDAYIGSLTELRKIVQAGALVPVCPELTNANPSAPHTVLLESFAWQLAQMGYRINQIPDQNLIEFARLFGIEPREAAKAETILRFVVPALSPSPTPVPVGTRVSTDDGGVTFETTEALTIPASAWSGEVLARNIVGGPALLAPNQLVNLIGGVAGVGAVTNPSAVDSGSAAETVEAALERMRGYQRRTERIVTAKDLEDAILFDAMNGNGVVRVFPFVANGDFDGKRLVGHTTVIVMTRSGDPVDQIVRRKIGALLNQLIGNQIVYVIDPVTFEFDVEVTVKANTATPPGAVAARVEQNLRTFYDASQQNFGRSILRSEIIALIEGTPGVDRIVPTPQGAILAAPLTDSKTRVWELPRLRKIAVEVSS